MDDVIKNATIVRCSTLEIFFVKLLVIVSILISFNVEEGEESEVLLSVDFGLVSFGTIVIESLSHDAAMNKDTNLIPTKMDIPVQMPQGYRWFQYEMF
jgi:hypothetical protein